MSGLPTRLIGDREVSAIGLGTSLMSIDADHDDQRSVRALRDALDAGVTLIDTAHAYATLDEPTHAERLVREAITGHPAQDNVLIATKGGHWRRGIADFPIDGRPSTLREHLEASLRALDVDVIGLYQLHHPDPTVPIEDSVGAIAEFRDAGLVQMIGVSNVSRALYERAATVTTIAAVQNNLSPFRTDDLDLVQDFAVEGVAYLSHSPFGGASRAAELAVALPKTAGLASSLGFSLQQLLLAWQLGLAPSVIPVVGARRSPSVLASAAAARIELDAGDRRLIHDEIVGRRPEVQDA
ncbi:MAG: aldo/keto reductase [Leifsonia sp.]|jgi:aryl-alcohol dehydrogenase-like predicted oxidoreductase